MPGLTVRESSVFEATFDRHTSKTFALLFSVDPDLTAGEVQEVLVEEIDENELDEGNPQARPRAYYQNQFHTEIRSTSPEIKYELKDGGAKYGHNSKSGRAQKRKGSA